MSERSAEIAIVGAGPIGLELAVALKRQGIDYRQFDARQIGHTMSWWAPQTRFFSSNERISIAGVPLLTPDQNKATREQYLTYLRGIVMQFALKVNTYEPVVGIDRNSDGFTLTTRPRSGDRSWRVKKIILATGGTDRPRKLNVKGDDQPHVSYYFRDPHDYFGQKVLIIGGKNSAIEAALRCYHAGAQVSLSYRRAELPTKSIKYWLTPEITGLIQHGRIKFYGSTVVTRIGGGTVTLAGCTSDFTPCGRTRPCLKWPVSTYRRSAARRASTSRRWRRPCPASTSPAPPSRGRRTSTASSSKTATSTSTGSSRI
jgi:thioredoxin reductase (NADPH)